MSGTMIYNSINTQWRTGVFNEINRWDGIVHFDLRDGDYRLENARVPEVPPRNRGIAIDRTALPDMLDTYPDGSCGYQYVITSTI